MAVADVGGKLESDNFLDRLTKVGGGHGGVDVVSVARVVQGYSGRPEIKYLC